MKRKTMTLRQQLIAINYKQNQLEADYCRLKEDCSHAINRYVRAERICEDLLEIMKNGAKEGKFPRS